jgi:hypothetical protein
MNSCYSVIANERKERDNLAVTSKSIGFLFIKTPKACFSLRHKGRNVIIANFEL